MPLFRRGGGDTADPFGRGREADEAIGEALVCGAGAQMSVTAAQAVRPDLAFGQLAAAALPNMMVLAVTQELIRRPS
jgi:hypothetical protein